MAGLVPAIYVFVTGRYKTWMPGTSPGMTSFTTKADSIGCIASETLRSIANGPDYSSLSDTQALSADGTADSGTSTVWFFPSVTRVSR
jgi:hypothetical protein